jgi:hypothetical protein
LSQRDRQDSEIPEFRATAAIDWSPWRARAITQSIRAAASRWLKPFASRDLAKNEVGLDGFSGRRQEDTRNVGADAEFVERPAVALPGGVIKCGLAGPPESDAGDGLGDAGHLTEGLGDLGLLA